MPDEFPSFDVPAGVPSSTPTATPTAETPSAAPVEPSTPAAPAPEPAAPTDPLFAPWSASQAQPAPAGDAPPAAPPAPPAQPEPSQTELLLAQQSQLLAALATRLMPQAPPEPGAPPPPPRDPKDVALEQALIKRVPALGQLMQIMSDPAKAQAFQALLDAAPGHQQTVQTFYEEYAETTASKLKGFYADTYGVDPKLVTREHEDMLTDQFTLWIEKPQNAKALKRYEAGDIRVVDEFASFFKQRFVEPARRQGQVALERRAAPIADLPRGGGSSIPTPQQSAPVQTPAGERDVFGEAWGDLQRARTAR
ncbi:MAG TPA: hypothetical protein VGK73_32350 [Polyangiaceae bacterium]